MNTTQAQGPHPRWQVGKGYKMDLKKVDLGQGDILIQGSAANLTIERSTEHPGHSWKVRWKIQHDIGEVAGSVYMTNDELARAFGLKDGLGRWGEAVAARVDTPVNAAEQGKFVRYSKYLNIPHPGIDLQGDPNIAIELDDQIRKAVKNLLEVWPETAIASV